MQNLKEKRNNKPKTKKKWSKTAKVILIVLIVALIAFRLYLPTLVKERIIAAINSAPGYACTIDDVDLMIYRGAMSIDGFKILITDNDVEEPFIDVKLVEGSIDWPAILDGKIVTRLEVTEPNVNFMDSDKESEKQSGGADWAKPLKEMMPLELNKFIVNDGNINFENKSSTPPVKLQLSKLNVLVTNLTNAKGLDGTLPSDLTVSAVVFESGTLNLDGKINAIKKMPDVDLTLKIDSVALRNLNDFTLAYAKFDFEKGAFAARSEFAMADGKIAGYFEPFFNKVKILDWKNEDGNFLNKLWQGVLGLGVELTENQKLDRTATKIKIEGSVDKPDINIIGIVINVFKNAFIEAYDLKLDNSIDFDDAKNGSDKDKNSFKGVVKDLFDGDGQSIFQSGDKDKKENDSKSKK